VDGERIPPFSQIDTYVVIKSQNSWFVTAHNMQEKKPYESQRGSPNESRRMLPNAFLHYHVKSGCTMRSL